jgi:hypothetical protein
MPRSPYTTSLPLVLREEVTLTLRVNFPAKLLGFVSQSLLGSVPNEGPDERITSPAFSTLLYARSNHGTGSSSWVVLEALNRGHEVLLYFDSNALANRVTLHASVVVKSSSSVYAL